jgi:nucleotide-binding universal stress UspA family protein
MAMQIKRILFATDLSSDYGALPVAESLARDRGAVIDIVHVEEPSILYGSRACYGALGPDTPLETLLANVLPRDRKIKCEHHLLTGDAASAICRFAADHCVDLIVMGSPAKTGPARVIAGSVAKEVVRDAPCAVLIVAGREYS